MRISKRETAQNNFSILTLDDDPIITAALQSHFQRAGYLCDVEHEPYRAIERVREGKYDILLLDYLMSPICGDQVVEEIRKFNKDIYIILLTGHKSIVPPVKTIRELDIQGYHEKSVNYDQLELLVESCVKSIKQMRTIRKYQEELTAANETLREGFMEMIKALRLLVDARDIYTRGHSDRVSDCAERIARAMGKDDTYCEMVRIAGLFHDIGKVGVSDQVLLKDSRLTDEEFDQIKKHPADGARILSAMSAFGNIVPIVRAHHERVDGRGYPDGLKGEEIPEASRMIAVADAFDAMTSNRSYRKALPLETAIAEVERGKGTQFDPAAADAFLSIVHAYADELGLK